MVHDHGDHGGGWGGNHAPRLRAEPPTGGADVEVAGAPPATVAWTSLFVLSTALLVGGPVVVVRHQGRHRERAAHLAAPATLVAVVAAAALGLRARDALGGSLSSFLETPVGEAALLRVVGLAVVAAAVAWWWGRRPAVDPAWVVAAGAVLALAGHATAGHAAGADLPTVNQMVQGAHMVAVGVWLGGLVALVVVLPGLPPHERVTAAERYSSLALGAFGAIVVTGAVRAVAELGTGFDPLLESTYGRLVLLKAELSLGLVVLAARNRWWNTPAAAREPGPLVRTGRIEAALAAGVVVVGAILANTSPPQHEIHAVDHAHREATPGPGGHP